MGVIRKIALAVLFISAVTFVALFGRLPALRKTPIGLLQRVLCVHIPKGLKAVDQRVTGGWTTVKGRKLGRYLFYEQNPVVLVLYLALVTGSATLFLWNAFSLLSFAAKVPIPLLLALPYAFTYLCVAHKGHHITNASHSQRLRDYPYDHVLYRPKNVCSTCQLPKPARSKHCSLCGVCIAKCDHHCPWVNNCLGRGNYRYFLYLLLSLGILQIYGAYLSYTLLSPHFGSRNTSKPLFSKEHWTPVGDGMVMAVNKGGLSIAGVGLLAASTATLPLGLLAYHLYLIWAGMTTNESSKWADWRDDMADGHVFRASREHLITHCRLRKFEHGDPAGASGHSNRDIVSDLGLDLEPDVYWPVSSDQVLVRTSDGKPPVGQEALWRRLWNLDEVDNIYDLGGWDNFVQVIKGK